MDKPGFYLSTNFLVDNSGIRKYFSNSFELLFARLLLGLWKGGLWNRQNRSHGSFQALERSLFVGHDRTVSFLVHHV